MLAFACCTYQSAAPFALMLGVTCPTIHEAKIPRNYTVGKDPESFPVTYTASPQLTQAAMAVPTWQYWSITDCKKQLVTCSCFRLFTEQGRNADLGSHCNFNPWKCHLRHMSHDRACTSPLKFPLRNSWGHLQLQAVFFVEIDPERVGQEQWDL